MFRKSKARARLAAGRPSEQRGPERGWVTVSASSACMCHSGRKAKKKERNSVSSGDSAVAVGLTGTSCVCLSIMFIFAGPQTDNYNLKAARCCGVSALSPSCVHEEPMVVGRWCNDGLSVLCVLSVGIITRTLTRTFRNYLCSYLATQRWTCKNMRCGFCLLKSVFSWACNKELPLVA